MTCDNMLELVYDDYGCGDPECCGAGSGEREIDLFCELKKDHEGMHYCFTDTQKGKRKVYWE